MHGSEPKHRISAMKKMTTEQALDELSMEQVLPVKNKMD